MIDGHSHFSVTTMNLNENKLRLEKYKNKLKQYGVSNAVLSINPYIIENYCNEKHPTKIYDFGEKEIKSICTKCNKLIYCGDDYFRKYNEVLLNSLYDDTFSFFLMLSISNNTIQNNIDYFLDKYSFKIKGLKLYTSFASNSLNDINIYNYGLPCLIHCSKYNNQIPSNMMQFIKNYDGKVILAHFGCLDYDAIKELKNYENVYIDVSPATTIYKENVVNHTKSCLLNISNINNVNDLYYRLFENFDIDKIIWGTDYPFSKIEEEISVVRTLKLSKSEYLKITEKNIKKII